MKCLTPIAVYSSESDQEVSQTENENMETDNQEESINTPTSSGKRDRKSKTVAVYISTRKQRTDTAKRTGQTLVRQIAEYQIKTGAQVYFKSLYKGVNKNHAFSHGENFKIDEFDTSLGDEAFQATPKKSGGPKKLPSGAACSAAVMPTFLPTKCVVCKNKDVVQNLIKYESNWIQCGGNCENCAHIDCLGFPGASAEEIVKLPAYYCPKHVQIGRKEKKVKFGFADEPEPTTSKRKQKKIKQESEYDSDSQ